MSNMTPFRNTTKPGAPTPPQGDTIASYATYLEAQKAVDYLSDNHFPVQAVTIVGVGVQIVERVTGRLTYARAALAGMASGAWFGLMIGLLLSIVSTARFANIIAAVLLASAFGLLFGLISYALTGGRRDFTSSTQIVATEYRVLCLPEQAGAALNLLNQLAGSGGPRSNPFGGGPAGPGAGQTPWGGPGPSAPAPVTPAPGDQTVPIGTPGRPEGSLPEPEGPLTTYGEMIDRQRAEEQAREKSPRRPGEEDPRPAAEGAREPDDASTA